MLPVTINNQEVTPLEYKGQRVVTFAMIDQLHQRPEGTAKRNFGENRHRFLEGRDYFALATQDEFRTESLATAFPPRTPSGTLLTEYGYLKLVKSFTDDLAWKIQDMLVDRYFRPALPAPAPEPGVYKVLLASTDEDDFWKAAVKYHKRLQRFPFTRQNALGFLLAFRLSLECAAQKVGTNPRHFVPFFDQLPALPAATPPDQVTAEPAKAIGNTEWAEVLAKPLTVGDNRPVRDLILAALDSQPGALATLACHGIAFPYLSSRDRGSTRCLFVANPAEKSVSERSHVVRELHSLITRANGRRSHQARLNVHGGRARGVVIPLDILPLRSK
ncbi:ORF6N domain-containing protein [Acidithiobacillus ferrooxidans]|uniref:ORF6N domain-containing protein n=1 Tax=Acidithiobacillus ferrooxidans TaxID=920 RepID=UPI00214AAD38|nr:ORF6N domain-containing protein [Acidithiobacillus ferrooxidans]MCR2831003.1 ORF6N domain-containing protein [Acidithiobacillus ferrooxidans]